jgi:hypothetical protein
MASIDPLDRKRILERHAGHFERLGYPFNRSWA